MPNLPRLSEESEESFSTSSSNSRAPNFSRPRPRPQPEGYPSQSQSSVDRSRYVNSRVRSIEAFHEPAKVFPNEPNFSVDSRSGSTRTVGAYHEPNRSLRNESRVSLDSERTGTTSSENSAGSENAWDGRTGELASRRRKKNFEEQRYAGEPRSRPTTATTGGSKGRRVVAFEEPEPTSSSTSFPKNLEITKRVSVDQQSERLSMSTDQAEDTRSHHTVSEDGDSGSFDTEGSWRSSDYDTSDLTDAQIRKLVKKGVNPALYAEMRAAKKGKNKFIGPLLGNSFLG